MATVRQTLALNDRMSPVLSKIISAMHTTLDVMEQVNVASGRGIGAGVFDKARTQINAANTALQQTVNEVHEVDNAVKKARTGFAGWQAAIVTANQGIILMRQGIHGLNQITSYFDGLMSISSRLNLITEDHLGLQDKIFAAAQRSRGEYAAMASTVAKLNLLAQKAFEPFGGEDATVKFAETLNKAFVISGAGTQERESAMYQMAQALSSGRLQGDEYRSIIENAPLVAQSIEDYMRNVKGAQGTLKDWSSEGLLTSDVLIAAVQNASTEIDKQFADMPMKFSDHMTSLRNEGIKAIAPLTTRFENLMASDKMSTFVNNAIRYIQQLVGWLDNVLEQIDRLSSTAGFQQFASEIGTVLNVVGTLLGWVLQGVLGIVNAITWAWPVVGPILWTVVAALIALKSQLLIQAGLWLWNSILVPAYTAVVGFLQHGYNVLTSATYRASAAQLMFNSALLASPIGWIILILVAVIAIIAIVVNVINAATGSTLSAIGVIVGGLSVAGAFIWNLLLGIFDLVLGVLNGLINPILAFVNFFGNVFNDPVGSIIHLFGQMGDNILGIIESIAKAIDKVVGSNLAGAVSGWRKNLGSFVDTAAKKYGNGAYEEIVGNLNLSSDSLGLGRWAYEDAYDWGYNAGSSIETSVGGALSDLLGGYDPTETPGAGGFDPEDYTDGNGFNVNADGSEVSLSDDDIKYLRDIAKLEYVSQYTTLRPVVQAQFGDVHETADVNQIITVLEDAIEGAYESSLARG